LDTIEQNIATKKFKLFYIRPFDALVFVKMDNKGKQRI